MPLNPLEVQEALSYLAKLEEEDTNLLKLRKAEREYMQVKGTVPVEDIPALPMSVAPRIGFLRSLLTEYTTFEQEKQQTRGEVSRLRQELEDVRGQLKAAETRYSRLQGNLRQLLKASEAPAPAVEPVTSKVTIPDRPQWNEGALNGGQALGR